MGEEKQSKGQVLTMMDQTELSLGPSSSTLSKKTQSSSSESEGCGRRKRKQIWDANPRQTSIELQLNDPLPLDWERCLDLQTGRIYYMNRKTLKRSWSRPKEQNLDLELNISTFSSSEEAPNSRSTTPEEAKKQHSSCGSMAAVVCVNCHLLVMLCKSSPSCPNCKCMQTPLPSAPQAPPPKLQSSKSPETLSLLH
ncbi:unnamed protein product [Musa acuminata subsp. malaccensis]|nr:PREDICTED: uncharacterized protein LOC103976416 [Musa acuminata subsp. malaccensis]CAG1861467.1 unnamed protein product [Musa acuminata subsp. malaccensis]